jgi:hypothetical protein
MPLCPQITNTPITVVQNADFTVSSVLPVVAATTTQLAATNASIQAAIDAANAAAAAAAVAAADAAAAQTAAAAALAEAEIAYDAAVGSLQPSANTIVNASNQITSIKSDGITIFSGADSTTGSRVVLNSLGLAAYGPGTSFAITNAVGNGTTVTYTASGHNFTVGSSVTVSDLAPAGYNGTFLVTAIAGSSTFTVANTTTATLTDASGIAFGPGRSVNITNAVGNGTSVTYTASNHGYSVGTSVTISGLAPSGYNGTFLVTSVVANTSFTVSNGTTATLTDASGVAQTPTLAISATTGNAVFQGSVTGSTIIGGTLNIAGKAVIDSTGLLTATGATITGTINAQSGFFGIGSDGWSITTTGLVSTNAATIVGGTIQGSTFLTSTGSNAVIINGPSNAIQFKNGGAVIANMVPLASNGLLMHYGATPDPSGGTFPQIYLGGGIISLFTNIGIGQTGISISANTWVALSGNVYVRDVFYNEDPSTVTNAANVRMDLNGRTRRSTASSVRYKENIVDLVNVDELHPRKLLDIPVRAFSYKQEHLSDTDDRSETLIPGFIAEEVDEFYPLAADYENGEPESWNDRILVPGMLALIQELHKDIQILKGE